MPDRRLAALALTLPLAVGSAGAQTISPRLPQDFERLAREYAEWAGAYAIAKECPDKMPDGVKTPILEAVRFYAANILRHEVAEGRDPSAVNRALASMAARAAAAVQTEVAEVGCESQRIATTIAFVRNEFEMVVNQSADDAPDE